MTDRHQHRGNRHRRSADTLAAVDRRIFTCFQRPGDVRNKRRHLLMSFRETTVLDRKGKVVQPFILACFLFILELQFIGLSIRKQRYYRLDSS